MAANRNTDWERVELDYRAGILSIREIAATAGVSHTAIQKKAKSQGWDRDLSARIKAKADALVAKAEVSKEVSAERLETEKQVVESNARAVADVRLSHRSDITRVKRVVLALLNELDEQTVSRDLYSNLGEILRMETDAGVDRLNDIYQKVIATPGRIDSVKKLSESLRILITLEREAWNIKEESSGLVSDLNKILEEIGNMPKRLPCDD